MKEDESKRTIPCDFWAVYFDETEYWRIAPEDAPHVERILGVYLYDRNEHVHLCELTPSYFMRHLYDTVVLRDYDAVSEDDRERISDRYETSEYSEDTYMHVSDVERIKASRKYHYGEGDPEETPEEQAERAHEHVRGNPPF